MTHVLMKSGNEFHYVEMNHSQIFEFLLKKARYKIPQGQDIEQHRRLYKLMDELKPTWDLVEELEYQAEMEKDEDIRTKLIAKIAQTRGLFSSSRKRDRRAF